MPIGYVLTDPTICWPTNVESSLVASNLHKSIYKARLDRSTRTKGLRASRHTSEQHVGSCRTLAELSLLMSTTLVY
jgi:hypothetical protein